MARYPSRIICLTEETVETLYLLGCGEMVVGISGFTLRPPEARKSKPKVSTYTEANYEKILALKPDLVLTFSDLQADIAKELMLRGVQVFGFNQRSVEEILTSILVLGGVVNKTREAQVLVEKLSQGLNKIRARANELPCNPRVYFEEWDDPMISCIRWVSELVEIAGGRDIFPEFRQSQNAGGRIVSSESVIERNPDIIIGSWCGKQFKPTAVKNRPGWEKIEAVRGSRLFEVKSAIILQPGPAALTEGVDRISQIILSSLS